MAFSDIFNLFNSVLDKIFGRVFEWNPLLNLILISLILVLFISLANKYLTDQKKMKELRDKQTSIKKEMKDVKDDPDKVMQLNKELFAHFPEMMKHQFKPMVITLIPLLFLFSWLRITYSGVPLNFLGFIDSWLIVYILVSILASFAFRKLLKIY